MDRAISLFNNGQYRPAIQVGARALQRRNDSVTALRLIGLSYFFLEQYDLAEKFIREAIAIAPLSEPASDALYLILSVSGQFKEALEEIRRFLLLADSPIHEEFLTGSLKALRWVPGEEAEIVQQMKQEIRTGDMEGFDRLMNRMIEIDKKFRGKRQSNTKAIAPMIPNLYYYNPAVIQPTTQTLQADICIYGGTSAGVAAAVEASRLGKSAILLEPGSRVGGLSSGGLGCTDFGNKDVIGGISREFYRRVGQKYGVAEEWHFEPHIAQQVFDELLQEAKVPVYYHQFLQAVEKNGLRLTSIKMEGGLTVRAKMFIDASYEGDLMAKSGVTYEVGRESNATYGETLNGTQVRHLHQFDFAVDPYVKEGDPTSGLLPGINAEPAAPTGTGDKRIQAYNFRLCLTKNADNRIPFPKPDNYDPQQYILLGRYLATGWNEVFRKFDPIRNHKVDKNNHGAISTDFIGMNYAWPEGDYATREKIFQQHVAYTQGLMWFMGNDPSVPQHIRDEWNEWGLCKDEFTELGGWSPQLYIREARRMKSDSVMTEHDCRGETKADDAVALGSYNMDSHNCQRFVKDGRVWNEGDVQIGVQPYPISYRAIVPKQGECENLLVPVCLSASHIAYGSIRMEPVFMALGQSAATAAGLALDKNVSTQAVPYAELQGALEKDGQVLKWGG